MPGSALFFLTFTESGYKTIRMFVRPKFLAALGVATLISIFCVNCSHNTIQPFPDPASGCAFFTEDYALPHTQSAQQLSQFLSSEHFEYDQNIGKFVLIRFIV